MKSASFISLCSRKLVVYRLDPLSLSGLALVTLLAYRCLCNFTLNHFWLSQVNKHWMHTFLTSLSASQSSSFPLLFFSALPVPFDTFFASLLSAVLNTLRLWQKGLSICFRMLLSCLYFELVCPFLHEFEPVETLLFDTYQNHYCYAVVFAASEFTFPSNSHIAGNLLDCWGFFLAICFYYPPKKGSNFILLAV